MIYNYYCDCYYFVFYKFLCFFVNFCIILLCFCKDYILFGI